MVKDSNGNGNVQATAQSICWLYCWAKTGQNSDKAAKQARRAFDAIFDRSYSWLDGRLRHENAQKFRYDPGNIEAEFYSAIDCR